MPERLLAMTRSGKCFAIERDVTIERPQWGYNATWNHQSYWNYFNTCFKITIVSCDAIKLSNDGTKFELDFLN
jgi:hypothetical protein